MAEEKAKKKKSKSGKRMRKWIWFVAIVILALAIGCYFLSKTGLLNSQTVDEQLAAIEAARAIPDSENAVTLYNVLLQDANATSLLDTRPGFLDDDSDILTFRQPWSGKDFPELAVWLKEQQHVIDRLLEVSKFDKCRFPIAIGSVQRAPYGVMRRWARLLNRAANNDIAEGRIDDAIDKWRCLLQMGNHLRQQPLFIEYMVAIAIEEIGLHLTAVFLAEGNADESHLRKVETLPLHTEDDWTAVLEEILPAEELSEQKMKENLGPLDRLRYEFSYGLFGSMKWSDYDRIHQMSLRSVATCRGIRILIALRRYRNKNGRWPQTLDSIKNLVPEQILVDPINGGSFAYKLTEENFTLYSKGENNIDEDGIRRVTFDTNSLEWLKTEEDDWLIWPTSSRKTKNEKADTQQSNTQKDEVK